MAQNRKHSSSRRRRTARQHKGADPRAIWAILAAGALLVIGVVFVLLRSNSGAASSQANFSPQVTGAPRVSVAQDTLDYGNVRLGTTINSVFTVHNVGDKPLQILGEPRVELVEGC